MDTSKAKKNTKKEVEHIKVDRCDLRNVRVLGTKNGDVVFFTLMINGVFINNCKVVSGKNGDFIALPQYKGSDDKWYNHVYLSLSDEDTKTILDMVQDSINNAE